MPEPISCHDCGLMLRAPEGERGAWFCPRCRARLGSAHHLRMEAVAALAVAALALWPAAMFLPLLSLAQFGREETVSAWSCVLALFQADYGLLAVLVAATLVAMPLMQMVALLVVVGRVRAGASPGRRWLWWYRQGREWAMPEIFLLGILIASTKLGGNARLHLETGLACLLAMVVLRLIAEALANPAALDRLMERRHDPAH